MKVNLIIKTNQQVKIIKVTSSHKISLQIVVVAYIIAF